MNAESNRSIVLSPESYDVIKEAVNTRELGDVNFGAVSEVTPSSMDPSEVKDFSAQFVDEMFVRKPEWDGSVKKLSTRLVFTLGQAACWEGRDPVTAKSAEKVLWKRGPVLAWGFAVMLRKDIKRSARS